MVPGSTLMYGSSFTIDTLIFRDSRIAASEAAAMPFPREETTPPVTKTYLVMRDLVLEIPILQERDRSRALALQDYFAPAPSPGKCSTRARRGHNVTRASD